jgi:cytochrome c oxidase subunit 2
MFSTASSAAARIAGLTWFMIVLSAVILALVSGIIVVALIRARRQRSTDVVLGDTGRGWVVWGGVAMPVVVLGSVAAFGFRVMYEQPSSSPALTIRVTGHQWWWQIDYDGADSTRGFRSANELHVPVGSPVRLVLTSADVIHSFWVPQLNGKLDLIPGDTNVLQIEASKAGRFGGACAEYCGAQHAHMAITVIAEDSASFAAWEQRERLDAVAPAESLAVAGERLFTTSACSACHTVRGVTPAREAGPDLTHVASRLTIAAGTLPMSLGALEGWIANPQALKPGALMPRLDAHTGPELRALASYVASLR